MIHNLLSLKQITNRGLKVVFEDEKATILSSKMILEANLSEGLYEVVGTVVVDNNEFSNVAEEEETLHKRFGHVSTRYLRKMIEEQAVLGLKVDQIKEEKFMCQQCVLGKHRRKHFKTDDSHHDPQEALEIVHSDIQGPLISNQKAKRYNIIYVDGMSRYTVNYPVFKKSDQPENFKEFKSFAERQTGNDIKILRTDNGGEYLDTLFNNYLLNLGIIHQCTVPYNPEQNGLAERMNRKILEMARIMLIDAYLSENYWIFAYNAAVYIWDRIPLGILNWKTPFEMLPDVSAIRQFGCISFHCILCK